MFLKYLKSKLRIIFIPFFFAIIYGATFYFYGLPYKAIVYPLVLCFFLGVCAVLADYYLVYKKYSELKSIKLLGAKIIDGLPESNCVLDDEYKQIIELLAKNQRESTEILSKKYDEMIEYYTTWAHQIKTPIAAMRLNLQNEDTSISRALQNDLTRIENYVEMVLAFLRLDSRSSDYVIKKYPVDKIIKDSVKKFSGEFISKKLTLSFIESGEMVLTDEKWLSFVVEQVISNALKYTKSGAISICVKNGILCVKDSGIGINKSDLPRIFEKGYTGSIGRADKKASGIGLYLCKRICDNLGHRISVFSDVGVGTTVEIDLKNSDTVVE